MRITFNTWRDYSNEGQIITASFNENTTEVLFHDHTRGVAGVFPAPYTPDDGYDFRAMVIDVYDRGRYEESGNARQLVQGRVMGYDKS